jgi:hypothetical protein
MGKEHLHKPIYQICNGALGGPSAVAKNAQSVDADEELGLERRNEGGINLY